MKKIPLSKPCISSSSRKSILNGIDSILESGRLMMGDFTHNFEKSFSEVIGTRYSVSTSTCTSALQMVLNYFNVAGYEVLVASASFITDVSVIKWCGATPIFVEMNPSTLSFDLDDLKSKITSRTKCVIWVHLTGIISDDYQEIINICKDNKLKLIEDCSHAHGSSVNGKNAGALGDVGCFSFQGAKLTVSGEGGIFVTDNEELFNKATLAASMGRTDSKAVFWSDSMGYQYTIANLTAALALAQVERVDELLAMKRKIFEWYYARLKDVPGIKIIKEKEGCESNYCYPSILLEDSISVDRDTVLQKLAENDIHCRPGFPQMSRFPMYEQRFENPVAKNVAERGISLASAANLDESDVDFVCQKLVEFIKG